MSNSKLVCYTKISPNSSARTAKIDTITIHHMGSTVATIESVGADFARKERKASSNYGVGSDGRIAMYVDESRRAWTSSNWQNDNRAVTIEVQNSTKAPNWEVSDKALEATIHLCVDICRRNKIPRLNYTGDKSGNLTMHKWFANTGCPGPYLSSKFQYIADEVNRRLGVSENTASDALNVGDVITLIPGTRYTSGKEVPSWVTKKTLYCRGINGNNVTFSILKSGAITGVTSIANIRKDGHIVADSAVPEVSFEHKVGDAVKLATGAKYADGKSIPAWVIKRTVYVRQIYSNGNIVFSIYKTGAITGVVEQKYIM